MDAGSEDPAEVLADGFEQQDAVRRAGSIDVAADVLAWVERRLDTARRPVADLFNLPLSGREGAAFLRYRPGGFYRAHRDRGDLPSWPAAADRQITLVVFLNDAFEGGVLRLWPEEEGDPIEIVPVAGTLVAFPAAMLHEVVAVRGGVRDAIVDWFV